MTRFLIYSDAVLACGSFAFFLIIFVQIYYILDEDTDIYASENPFWENKNIDSDSAQVGF